MCGIVSIDTIILDIDAYAKEEVIDLLCNQLKMKKRIKNDELFYQEVMKRENTFPTSIGKLVAIPHGISSSVKESSICFGRLKRPVLWDEEKHEYVRIVVLIAVPKENNQNIHLHIISHLMRQFMHDEYVENLLISNKNEIYLALEEGLE